LVHLINWLQFSPKSKINNKYIIHDLYDKNEFKS